MKKIACLLIAAPLLCLACSGLAENAPFTLLDYFSVDAETLALCKTYLSEL